MAEDILTTRPGTYQQDVLQSFLSLSIMVKWMTDANNASNVISEVKGMPLAAMTHLLISTKGAFRRPKIYDNHPISSHPSNPTSPVRYAKFESIRYLIDIDI